MLRWSGVSKVSSVGVIVESSDSSGGKKTRPRQCQASLDDVSSPMRLAPRSVHATATPAGVASRQGLRSRRGRCDAAMLSSLPLLLLNAFITFVYASSDYHEQLLLRPLPQDTLLASFNFRSNESAASFEQQNFRYLPRSLGQILQHAHAKELHLRFSVGRWDAESWGQRPWHGAREGGTGVELWAWVEADTEDEYEKHYHTQDIC